MDMKKNQIESSSYFLKNNKKGVNGRLYFDYVVLTVHENTEQYQGNLICWLEEYVTANLDSAKNMPLVAQFIDETKSEPLGHGYVTEKNGKVVFVDSEQVGSITEVEIRDVSVGEKNIRALVATAYINEHRYPQLCQWLRATMFEEKPISTSVEIFAKKNENSIVCDYVKMQSEESSDFEICVPKSFDFGGSAILTMTPADENAIILEILNSRINLNKEKEDTMKIEDLEKELKTAKETISELETKINSLEEEKESFNKEKESFASEKTALETLVQELQDEKEELSEFKADKEKEEIVEDFEEKIADFDEELVSEVKEDVDAFKEDPTQEKSEEIINSLNALFVKKVKEEKELNAKEVKTQTNTLFVEMNEEEKNTKEDFVIFEK